jgi:hypothetical protein
MMKLRFLIVAAVACFSVGAVSAAVAKPHHHHHHHHKPKKLKVRTKVNFTYTAGQAPTTFDPYHPYDPYDPYGQNASFQGKLKAKKGCARRRSITTGALGHTSSAKDGTFGYTVDGPAAADGRYRLHVKGKTFMRGHGKHKRKIRCKPAFYTLMLQSAKTADARPQKATHVGSKVKIHYQAPGNEYTPDTGFTGKVKAKHGCAAKRTVKLSHYGKTKTSKKGAFAFGVSQSGAAPGNYKVKVKKRSIDGGDTVCSAVKAKITVNG